MTPSNGSRAPKPPAENTMVTMQGLAVQELPHDIPPEASADYSHTRWPGKLDIDGSELYLGESHRRDASDNNREANLAFTY